MSSDNPSPPGSTAGLASIPTAQGALARLAIARIRTAALPVAPLLRRAGLTFELIDRPQERLSVRSQIMLLDAAAVALEDDCLGFTMARDFDLRQIGLLYYVMASSQTLGDALKRVARYSRINNEALVLDYREGNRLTISLSYSGVARHSDRHQMEFCMFAMIRICRTLTGQALIPHHVSICHQQSRCASEMARFAGTQVEFGAERDELALDADARSLPVVNADPYLNDLLLKYCEAALAERRKDPGGLRTKVEDAIAPLLPHGRVRVEDIARTLAMSKRTLARKLSAEGSSFNEILQSMKRDLAMRYLDEDKLHVSNIAWLLGFREVSAFTHAFRRWTGTTPSRMRAGHGG